jgi:nucleoid-associated protein YgaU
MSRHCIPALAALFLAGCATVPKGEVRVIVESKNELYMADQWGMGVEYQDGKSAEEERTEANRPAWVKNINREMTRDDGKYRIIKVYAKDELFNDEAAARDYLKREAEKAFSANIQVAIKTSVTSMESGEVVNGRASSREQAESRIEASSAAAIRGLDIVAVYWELASWERDGKKVRHAYAIWGVYGMPLQDIEDAKKLAAEDDALKKIQALRVNQDAAAFERLKSQFAAGNGVRDFFSGEGRADSALFSRRNVYLDRYGELIHIRSKLLTLETLKDGADYAAFLSELKGMISEFEPTDRLLLSKEEQWRRQVAAVEEESRRETERKNQAIGDLNAANAALHSREEQHRQEMERKNQAIGDLNAANAELRGRVEILGGSLSQRVRALENRQGSPLPNRETMVDEGDYIGLMALWSVPDRAESGEEKTYAVQEGDTLVKIARSAYGSALFWFWLWKCNLGLIEDPNLIKPGTSIWLAPEPPEAQGLRQAAAR